MAVRRPPLQLSCQDESLHVPVSWFLLQRWLFHLTSVLWRIQTGTEWHVLPLWFVHSGSVISENVPVGVPIIHLALFHDKRLGCICYVPTSRHSSLIFKYNTKCENLQAGYVCIMWYLQLPDRQVWVCVFAWMIASEDKSMCRKRSCLLCRYARFSLSAHSCATAITVTVTVKLADKTQQAALDTCTCPIIFMCVCVCGWMGGCVYVYLCKCLCFEKSTGHSVNINIGILTVAQLKCWDSF